MSANVEPGTRDLDTSGRASPLLGKVAVVTGASRGIGQAIALRLAELGCDVAVAARTVEPRPDLPGSISATAEEIRALGRRCVPVATDVSQEADIERLADVVYEELGRVDILVNNAAALDERMYQTFWEMSSESWRYQLDVNLTSVWLAIKAFAPRLREQGGGLIINMTSALAGMPRNPNLPGKGSTGAAYTTSKAALSRLTEDLSKELAPYGITLVGIHPGFVRTDNGERLAPVGGFDMGRAMSTDVPLAVVEHLVTTDPSGHAGDVLFAPKTVEELGLLTG